MDDAIKKHKSASVPKETTAEVMEGETLLDHLIKLTTGQSHFAQDSHRILSDYFKH